MHHLKYGNYPQDGILPFTDLPPKEDIRTSNRTIPRRLATINESLNERILEHKDSTLLFMTMAVTLTSQNEMPIVKAYVGKIPTDIRGIHRAAPKKLFHLVPHFYFEDARILQYWNKPFATEKILHNFKVSIGIDFSMTNEMSRPQKMYASFLNKLWCAWLQSRGLHVIPNISFPDEWWEDYWIEGWPKHSVIAISSVGVTRHGNPDGWLKSVNRIRQELRPTFILRYGPKIPGEDCDNCIYFANDNNRSAHGWK